MAFAIGYHFHVIEINRRNYQIFCTAMTDGATLRKSAYTDGLKFRTSFDAHAWIRENTILQIDGSRKYMTDDDKSARSLLMWKLWEMR